MLILTRWCQLAEGTNRKKIQNKLFAYFLIYAEWPGSIDNNKCNFDTRILRNNDIVTIKAHKIKHNWDTITTLPCAWVCESKIVYSCLKFN